MFLVQVRSIYGGLYPHSKYMAYKFLVQNPNEHARNIIVHTLKDNSLL